MTQVRFIGNTTIDGKSYRAGQLANFPQDKATMYITAGTAQLASDPPAGDSASRGSSPGDPESHPGYRTRVIDPD